MALDHLWGQRFANAQDYWVVVRSNFDINHPMGMIFNVIAKQFTMIEDDAKASEVVSYLIEHGAKVVSVEEYRSWALNNS